MKKNAPLPTKAEEALARLNELRDSISEALSDEDRDTLSTWEKLIKGHTLRTAWLNHPITGEVFGKLIGMVADLDTKLSTDEGMSETERHAIFREKKAFVWLLTLFADAKDDTILQSLSEEIATRKEDYQNYLNK